MLSKKKVLEIVESAKMMAEKTVAAAPEYVDEEKVFNKAMMTWFVNSEYYHAARGSDILKAIIYNFSDRAVTVEMKSMFFAIAKGIDCESGVRSLHKNQLSEWTNSQQDFAIRVLDEIFGIDTYYMFNPYSEHFMDPDWLGDLRARATYDPETDDVVEIMERGAK